MFTPSWLPPDATRCPACGCKSVLPVVTGTTQAVARTRTYTKTVTERVCRARASAAVLSVPCGWRERYSHTGEAA